MSIRVGIGQRGPRRASRHPLRRPWPWPRPRRFAGRRRRPDWQPASRVLPPLPVRGPPLDLAHLVTQPLGGARPRLLGILAFGALQFLQLGFGRWPACLGLRSSCAWTAASFSAPSRLARSRSSSSARISSIARPSAARVAAAGCFVDALCPRRARAPPQAEGSSREAQIQPNLRLHRSQTLRERPRCRRPCVDGS